MGVHSITAFNQKVETTWMSTKRRLDNIILSHELLLNHKIRSTNIKNLESERGETQKATDDMILFRIIMQRWQVD